MIRETASEEFTVVVRAKQKPDGLWVADIQIDPEPIPETRRVVSRDVGFKTRSEAEEHGMKIADELIYKKKRR
jgi:hypothetical protein